jgi:hypothetical protein
VSAAYASAPLDTALAVLAYAEAGQTPRSGALSYLKGTQRTGVDDQGWAVGAAGASDAATTALVAQALARHRTQDPTLATPIAHALNTLAVLVDASAPPLLQALAAQAALDAGDPDRAASFLSRLSAAQSTEGHWNADPYATALATRALAQAAYSSDLATAVSIPDQALRKAINQTLGRNAMDHLNRGELAQLSALSAAGWGIGDLTGLEWAVNLTRADLRNNQIASTAPIDGLARLTDLQLSGNPVSPPSPVADGDIPTLPEWGVIAMASLLPIIATYARRNSKLS